MRAHEVIDSMKHGKLLNYIAPGLNSSLIGQDIRYGRVRVFESLVDQIQPIAPHSHRYDFACLVLKGSVRNLFWQQSSDPKADQYHRSTIKYQGQPGNFELEPINRGAVEGWVFSETEYSPGEWYVMQAEHFHSIYFSKGTEVLFFEGPTRLEHSQVLQPYVNGQVVPTFKIEPWMFRAAGRVVDGGVFDGAKA